MNINFKPAFIDFKNGSVILAGAGPGATNQITIKVYQALKTADVIIYDALVNKKLLEISKKSSKHIYAGKIKNKRACSQHDINKWMISYAQKNKKVLRLKGGDTSFFSRGSQEISFLKKYKIDFKIFTGITSSQYATRIANLNFFNENAICNFITGHKQILNNSVSNCFETIFKNNGRIFIYMGISQIKQISSKLIKLGMKKNTKVFIISNASLPNEKTFISNISTIEETILENKISPPSIIIVN